jgi:hypothetical protein
MSFHAERGMISHHDQISIPKIAKRACQLHEPLAIIHFVPKHDRALEIVRFKQRAIRDQLVLAVHFDCHLQRGICEALDCSKCHASISACSDESLHMVSVLAISEDWI